MNYLVLAYFRDVEGKTDWPFLEPVCRRLLEELLRGAIGPVEIQRMLLPLGSGERSVASQQAHARDHGNEFHIAFLHADGKGDPGRTYRERIAPVADALPPESGARIVGVIPVHETEAWMLCDGNALRDALGSTLDDERLGVPRAAGEIETLADPKTVLDAVHVKASGGRRHRRRAGPPRTLLGEKVAIDALRRLTAFRSFEAQLRQALVELGFLPN
jgi:hypothetical protein